MADKKIIDQITLKHRLAIAVLSLWPEFSLAAAESSALEVNNAYVREVIPNQHNTAAFMSLENNSSQRQTLVSIVSDEVERIELHRHVHSDTGMAMERVEQVSIEAGDDFIFAPGGYHLMLIGVERSLSVGQNLGVELIFADGQSLDIELPVVGY